MRLIKFIRCFYYNLQKNELMLRAAALAYYAIFSIFPLLLLITAAIGVILRNPAKQRAIIDSIASFMPSGASTIVSLIKSIVLSSAISTSIVAILTLFWSATGFLRGLLATVDRIHAEKYTRSSLHMRAIGIVIILLSIPALFLTLMLASFSHEIIRFISLPDFMASMLNVTANQASLFIIASIAFYLILRYVPAERPRRRIAFTSAIVTSIGWAAVSYGFAWYLNSDFAHFSVVYGSIGVVIALMLYLYLMNLILLIGAQLNALLSRYPHCTTPHVDGLDDLFNLLHVPIPEEKNLEDEHLPS